LYILTEKVAVFMWAGQDDNNINAFSYYVAEMFIVRAINGTFQV